MRDTAKIRHARFSYRTFNDNHYHPEENSNEKAASSQEKYESFSPYSYLRETTYFCPSKITVTVNPYRIITHQWNPQLRTVARARTKSNRMTDNNCRGAIAIGQSLLARADSSVTWHSHGAAAAYDSLRDYTAVKCCPWALSVSILHATQRLFVQCVEKLICQGGGGWGKNLIYSDCCVYCRNGLD